MAKNIIICCDGTSNKIGDNLTNVARAFAVFEKEGQVLFYEPGVGSIADVRVTSFIKRKFFQMIGLGMGYGLKRKVSNAYKFLMQNYNEGDKVFLFGFSRGSYTIRVLTGLIHTCGLLDKDNEQLLPYAFEIYAAEKVDFENLGKFKSILASRDCPFHFMGMWDSVSSVGTIFNMRNYPFTSTIAKVGIIRHAIAIDEKRAFFLNNTIKTKSPDCLEVWFPGVHGDVGGGNPELESGQAKLALVWMLKEAKKAGIVINEKRYDEVVLGLTPKLKKPKSGMSQPNILGSLHKNNFVTWGILEFVPKRKTSYIKVQGEKTKKIQKWFIPFFRRRKMESFNNDTLYVHRSVVERLNGGKYSASNLKDGYVVID